MKQAISTESIKEALSLLGGTGSASCIAAKLGSPKTGHRFQALKEELNRLVHSGAIFPSNKKYSLEPPPRWEDKIIEALGNLKRQRKYPALPGEIQAAIGTRKISDTTIKKVLGLMGKDGLLVFCQKGRYRAYLLGGEDLRYGKKPDEKMKFELLFEIEALKTRVLEALAQLSELAPDLEANAPPIDDNGVLLAIRNLAKRRSRRTVELWEIREALASLSNDQMDTSLTRLGTSWKVELQPVQDFTRLSPRQKDSLLRLSDGTMIVAVAVTEE